MHLSHARLASPSLCEYVCTALFTIACRYYMQETLALKWLAANFDCPFCISCTVQIQHTCTSTKCTVIPNMAQMHKCMIHSTQDQIQVSSFQHFSLLFIIATKHKRQIITFWHKCNISYMVKFVIFIVLLCLSLFSFVVWYTSIKWWLKKKSCTVHIQHTYYCY